MGGCLRAGMAGLAGGVETDDVKLSGLRCVINYREGN